MEEFPLAVQWLGCRNLTVVAQVQSLVMNCIQYPVKDPLWVIWIKVYSLITCCHLESRK